MACPYYRERLGGKVVGYCKDSRENIPSQKHQDCLCQSSSGMYSDFCPIYSKLQAKRTKTGLSKPNIYERSKGKSSEWGRDKEMSFHCKSGIAVS